MNYCVIADVQSFDLNARNMSFRASLHAEQCHIEEILFACSACSVVLSASGKTALGIAETTMLKDERGALWTLELKFHFAFVFPRCFLRAC